MKIGVYGDSFASNKLEGKNIANFEQGISWFEYIGQNGHDVTSFGSNGSSLFFSVQNFLKTHNNFDKIVFLVTSPKRFRIANNLNIEFPEHFRHVATFYSTDIFMEEAKRRKMSKDVKHIIDVAREYMIHIQDDAFDLYVHNLMVAEISRIRPDSVIIPCFSNSMYDLGDTISLLQINEEENKSLGENWNKDWEELIRTHIDLRRCHMTEENNIMIGNKILDCIKNNSKFSVQLSDIIIPKESIMKNFIHLDIINNS